MTHPQCAYFSLALFLIFINNIEQCISPSAIRCFADDTRFSYSIYARPNMVKLPDHLNNVISWSEKRNVALHQDKFEYMCHIFKRNNSLDELPFVCELFHYSVPDRTPLCPVDQLRDLEVLISSDLSWSSHIRTISDKSSTHDLLTSCSPSMNPWFAAY